MKKFLTYIFLHFLCVFTYAQNGVFIFNHESDTLWFNSNKIVSISIDGQKENQIITYGDTVFSLPIVDIDSICFVKHCDCVRFYDKEKRLETYIGKDGSYLDILYNDNVEPLSLQMILPDDTLGYRFVKTEFDIYLRPI